MQATIINRGKIRRGYTLVELLVVIGVIAVLASLAFVFIGGAYRPAENLFNGGEIARLQNSLERFKADFKAYPPSSLRLREDLTTYDKNDPYEVRSLEKLHDIWNCLRTKVDWNGDGKFDGVWDLSGDQCLVFFLGGMQRGPKDFVGFSDRTSKNPANLSDRVGRRGPYFTFSASRLVDVHGNGFLSYVDVYHKTPFAYFNFDKNPNIYALNDCVSIHAAPYEQTGTPRRFHSSTTFQLVSAGRDTQFGRGVWDPANPDQLDPSTGIDDRTNFCPNNILGAGAK